MNMGAIYQRRFAEGITMTNVPASISEQTPAPAKPQQGQTDPKTAAGKPSEQQK
jgi:hypothetical protein